MDIIVYIPNMIAFRSEAKVSAEAGVLGFSIDEGGGVNYNVSKIPVVYNGLKSVCLIRVNEDEKEVFDSLESCYKIGECIDSEYIFDVDGEELYNSVYDQSPIEFIDEEASHYYTPPSKIGLFAQGLK